MSLARVGGSEGFSEGAQLWVLSGLAQARWTRRLDWYLNLQLLKAEPHRPRMLSPHLRNLIQQEELELPQIQIADNAPLMIAARPFVPVDQIVILFETESKKWVTQAQRVWSQLTRPTTRLFLPSFVTEAEVKGLWPHDSAVSVVLEP